MYQPLTRHAVHEVSAGTVWTWHFSNGLTQQARLTTERYSHCGPRLVLRCVLLSVSSAVLGTLRKFGFSFLCSRASTGQTRAARGNCYEDLCQASQKSVERSEDQMSGTIQGHNVPFHCVQFAQRTHRNKKKVYDVPLIQPWARRRSRSTGVPRNNFGWTASPSSKRIKYIVLKRSK
jgi:hypothetical protein